MNSWDADFWMDKFERGDIVIAPDDITFRATEPYDCSSKAIFKFDSGKEVTATSNVSYALNKLMSMIDTNTTSYATLDGLDSNPCAAPAHYNFGVKGLRRPVSLNFCF